MKTDRPAVGGDVRRHMGPGGLDETFGRDGTALRVERLEEPAIEAETFRVLPRQHRVGPGAGGDQHRARRKDPLGAVRIRRADRPGMAALVRLDRPRRKAWRDTDSLLQGERDLLMVQAVARRVRQVASVGDGDAAPGVQQAEDGGFPALVARRLPFGPDRARVGQKRVADLRLLGVPDGAHGVLADLGGQGLVTAQELLDLRGVVGQRLGRRVDRGQPAADHDRGQAQLQVGHRVPARRAGQLQGHQEVRRHAHAARQRARHVDDGRPAGAGAVGDMVETVGEGVLDGERSAEADAAEHAEALPPLQLQPDELQEVLVPARGDAVFGDAAEARHDPVVEVLVERFDVPDGPEGAPFAHRVDSRQGGIERLDLQTVHRDDGMAVVDEVVSQIEAGRPRSDHQNAAPGGGPGQRTFEVQRIPARQQAVDLEAPGQGQHVLERAGLDLRDVHRLLALVDAGLHAVVADAVAGGGDERVVDHGDGERRQAAAPRLQRIHFADLLVERAARQRRAAGGDPEGAVPVLQALRAAVLAPVVAEDAIVGLVERAREVHADIGQGESLPATQAVPAGAQHGHAVDCDRLDRHEVFGVDFLRQAEQRTLAVARPAFLRERGPGGEARGGGEPGGVGLLVLEPDHDRLGEGQFVERPADRRLDLAAQSRAVRRGQLFRFEGLGGPATHETELADADRVEAVALRPPSLQLAGNAEERRDEVLHDRAQVHQQIGKVLVPEASGRGPAGRQAAEEARVARFQRPQEGAVEPDQPVAVVKVRESQPVGQSEIGHGRPGTRGGCVEPRRAACLEPTAGEGKRAGFSPLRSTGRRGAAVQGSQRRSST